MFEEKLDGAVTIDADENGAFAIGSSKAIPCELIFRAGGAAERGVNAGARDDGDCVDSGVSAGARELGEDCEVGPTLLRGV